LQTSPLFLCLPLVQPRKHSVKNKLGIAHVAVTAGIVFFAEKPQSERPRVCKQIEFFVEKPRIDEMVFACAENKHILRNLVRNAVKRELSNQNRYARRFIRCFSGI